MIRSARSYTIPEAAEALGVSVGTVRGWVRLGLRLLSGQRPFLILGSDLRGYLEARRAKGRVRLAPEELYCLSCKAPRRPFGMLVDWHCQTAKTARMVGLCEACGGSCNRMVSARALPRIRTVFDVAIKDEPAP
ncbi:MAG: helix-turn-helix domain-containing protein [Rhodobacteraceae bacterium]|nr:helix-turn-helix domain-containing protein [Paracoccaceae bacterium]